MHVRIVSTEASASLPDLPVTPALLTTCERGPERGLGLVEQAHHLGFLRHIALARNGVGTGGAASLKDSLCGLAL